MSDETLEMLKSEQRKGLKTEWKLAFEHVSWFVDMFSHIMKKCLEEFFVHGFKHGQEYERDSMEQHE